MKKTTVVAAKKDQNKMAEAEKKALFVRIRTSVRAGLACKGIGAS